MGTGAPMLSVMRSSKLDTPQMGTTRWTSGSRLRDARYSLRANRVGVCLRRALPGYACTPG